VVDKSDYEAATIEGSRSAVGDLMETLSRLSGNRRQSLDKVLRAIISHTMMVIFEHDGQTPDRRYTPLIDPVEVTLLSGDI
jgi:hypothetical protein